MDKLLEKLLDTALGGLGSIVGGLAPEVWKRRALAELRERNPFAQIALNDDLMRAVRLAWIEAALEVVKTAEILAEHGEWGGQGEAICAFADLARGELRTARTAALDTERDPGSSPIDAHAQAVFDGVAETVAPASEAELGAAIRVAFVGTLAALTGWPEVEIPAVFGQVAASGLAVEGGQSRRFGDLVLAAFAEILKSPTRYPEAKEAFHIAMEKAACHLAERTLAVVQGIDGKIDQALAKLDGLAVARDGFEAYLGLLNEIADTARLIDNKIDAIGHRQEFSEAEAEKRHRASLAQQALLVEQNRTIIGLISAEKGIPIPPLQAILVRMGETGVPNDQIVARLHNKADEYIELKRRLASGGKFSESVARARLRANQLLDLGDLDGARRLLDEIRASVRESRQSRAREEAALLADEAEIDHIQIRYKEAADKYSEAAALTEFESQSAWYYTMAQAAQYHSFGDEFGINKYLISAIAIFGKAIALAPRDHVPLDWATTQNSLGNALTTLGEREAGTARLKEAVTAFRAALEERRRDRVPHDWAVTQNNLGTVLQTLGEREAGTEYLREAVNTYRAVLEEFTQDRVPLDWAMTQNNLGNALRALGERETGTVSLEEAVFACRAALEEYTRERVPLDWAMTQNNLGNALRALGAREAGTKHLKNAAAAFRAALEEYTRDRVPLRWAMTKVNLGATLEALGVRETGIESLEEGVTACRAALQEHTRDRVPLLWATTQNNLGTLLQTLGTREVGTERLMEAVNAFCAALEEHTRDLVPLLWAATQNNLGNALLTLGQRESGTKRLEEAVTAFRAALGERRQDNTPFDCAITTQNLCIALINLANRSGNIHMATEGRDTVAAALVASRQTGYAQFIQLFEELLSAAEALIRRLSRR